MIYITPKSLADWTIRGDEKDLRQDFLKDRHSFMKAYWSDRSLSQVLTLYVMLPIGVGTLVASLVFGFFNKALVLLLTFLVYYLRLPEVDGYTRVTLPSGKSIAFLQIFPLTKEEMEGAEELKQNISNDPKFIEKVLENRI